MISSKSVSICTGTLLGTTPRGVPPEPRLEASYTDNEDNDNEDNDNEDNDNEDNEDKREKMRKKYERIIHEF